MDTNEKQARKLAIMFSKLLLRDIGRANLREVNRRNFKERSVYGSNLCASHDFCDANQTMLDAMDALGISTDDLDATAPLMNRAWDIAKENRFRSRIRS